jgi:hypothetical protein
MTGKPSAVCPCTDLAVISVEWECPRGHKGYAALCQSHGQIHVAALLSGAIMCGRCRQRDGKERAVILRRVNGKLVSRRLGRTAL